MSRYKSELIQQSRRKARKDDSMTREELQELERETKAHKIFDLGKKYNAAEHEISSAITGDWD